MFVERVLERSIASFEQGQIFAGSTLLRGDVSKTGVAMLGGVISQIDLTKPSHEQMVKLSA